MSAQKPRLWACMHIAEIGQLCLCGKQMFKLVVHPVQSKGYDNCYFKETLGANDLHPDYRG